MLVIVAPGQGAQTPGFLEPWLADPVFENRLNWLSAVAGLDLAHYGTKADAETIRDTAIAQPLLVASSMLSALALFPHPGDAFQKMGALAGHSVGELAAAVGAGVISAEQAMVLVRERGKAMAAASALTPTSMTAVLGGDRDEILAKLEQYGLTAANDNGPGQIVAAGTVEELAALQADPPAKTRLIPLSVAGAFHTKHMEPAVETLAGYARSITTHDPRTRLISNRRRPDRARRPRRTAPARPAGQRAGPLGPVHADDGRPAGHRHPGDDPGRHADRDRPARAQGGRDVRAEDAGPARRRPRASWTSTAARRNSTPRRPGGCWWHR